VERGTAERAVVGAVQVAGGPGLAEVAGDDEVRAVPADRRGDVPPQAQAFVEPSVRVPEEFDLAHADDRGGRPFLVLAQRTRLRGRETGDAGLPAGGEDIAHVLALVGPDGDGRRDPVLDVVGVRGHDQDALELPRKVLHTATLPRAAPPGQPAHRTDY